MAEATFTFPQGFLWGTATSSHQVEGNNINNTWSAWENEGKIINGQKSGRACDWWNGKWEEDFDRAADTGQNSHRMSVEWSRIQPAPNQWDEDAIDHYRQMVKGLRERGITPMVSLHHVTDPLWLKDMRGWENDFVVDYFKDFTQKVVEGLGDFVDFWCTINEPNIYLASGYLFGDYPPGKKGIQVVYKVIKNFIQAHASAYQVIHEIQPHAKVGITHNIRGFTAKKPKFPLDRLATKNISQLFNHTFPAVLSTGKLSILGKRISFPEAKGTQDYFGLNYYTRDYVSFSLLQPQYLFFKRQLDPNVDQSPTGFIANEPKVFFDVLNWARHFGLPIYVTENGIEDKEDKIRPKYLIQHLHEMWRGINYNWPIKGYFHWTLVDNFEWERGWTQRFGLWELDLDTQSRKKRRSASLYEDICKSNSLTSTMVSEYAPDLSESMFPG